jgi:hypothetical protein
MAKVKDVLIHVQVETAVRLRKCHRSKKHAVTAGATCLVIKDGMYSRNYCGECARQILALASSRLAAIFQQLGLFAP